MSKATDRLRFSDVSQVWHFSVLGHGERFVFLGRHSQFIPLLCVRKSEYSQSIAAIRTAVDDQNILSSGIAS